MKRKLSFFVALFLCAQVVQAQFEIGISGGYNNNYLHTSTLAAGQDKQLEAAIGLIR